MNILRTASGVISIKETNGAIEGMAIGPYRDLKLTQEEYTVLYNAYKSNPASVEKTLNEVLEDRKNGGTQNNKAQNGPTLVRQALQKMINFFTEFQFTPSLRFVNTLCIACQKDKATALSYINNYFKLMDNPFVSEVSQKLTSNEFSKIIDTLIKYAIPTKTINERLSIYYGEQGTGKTTEALRHTNNSKIPCNESMQPCDLIEDFRFDDGKAAFHPSALVRAMENGETIVLDEMNLLPFDSLRFLQNIADGSDSFEWKGNTIHINKGFHMIGTMNLVVNGTTYGLPAPLIDRCSELKEFTLDADMLMSAI